MAFARFLIDLLEEMKATAMGQPKLPEVVPTALETFSMEWHTEDVWGAAEIPELFQYLRKAKSLQIPQEWEAVVPKAL